MKKLLIILLAGIFIAGCSGTDGAGENSDGGESEGNQFEEDNEGENEQSEEDGKEAVYQIGETAQITSSSYGFPYEVTVNDFKVTKEVEGYSVEDFFMEGSEPSEETRLAVVNITMKNTGNESFVPDEKISAELIGELTSVSSETKVFTERKEELGTDEEITGNLVFVSNTLFDDGLVYLIYEFADPDEEVKFELPVPEK
ncbi:hypothetical protein [Lentibacillus salicampi]|uniref:DUF4352 domain-containing protein n=1 Tax=Lentibacillus salicampi TaxID=175306 RepID=A0A4Y9A717_9BACI|nr:hypothetical protein [Lentibacillus salicampi]TFJ91205.1 hypothetical protein E4U82_18950 [Lentibacillus salicampi]